MSATPAEQPEGAAVPRTAEKRWPMAAAVLATIVLQWTRRRRGASATGGCFRCWNWWRWSR